MLQHQSNIDPSLVSKMSNENPEVGNNFLITKMCKQSQQSRLTSLGVPVLVATKQEMDSAGMFEDERDFCSHIRLEYYGCMRRNTLSWWKCKGIDNELWDCYSMNRIHDMKEFERERRLNARERRIHEKEARASLEE